MTRHVTAADANGNNGEGPWWVAHEHPERPMDDHTLWSWACDPCMLHLITAQLHSVEGAAAQMVVGGTVTMTTVTETLSTARAWRAERGLKPL
jgi:hypothetical protein